MVKNMVLRWPKPLFFMVLGAHGIQFLDSIILPHIRKNRGHQLQQYMACFFSVSFFDRRRWCITQIKHKKFGPTKIASLIPLKTNECPLRFSMVGSDVFPTKIAPFKRGTFVRVQGKFFPRTPIGAGLGRIFGTTWHLGKLSHSARSTLNTSKVITM